MRTTLCLNDDLLRQAKEQALHAHTSLTALVEESLRNQLLRVERKHPPKPPPRLPTFKGRGLNPGIDLDSNRALLDAMEGR